MGLKTLKPCTQISPFSFVFQIMVFSDKKLTKWCPTHVFLTYHCKEVWHILYWMYTEMAQAGFEANFMPLSLSPYKLLIRKLRIQGVSLLKMDFYFYIQFHVCIHMYCGMCGGKMTACESLFSPSGMWIFKMGLRPSGSVVGKESNVTPLSHSASLLKDTASTPRWEELS